MDLKIYSKTIEEEAINQVNILLQQEAFKDCKVRIMPDAHAGKGCVVGFTAHMGEKVIPNIVGVDIGCGMLTVKLKEKEINLPKLDDVIKKYVPSGKHVHQERKVKFDLLQSLKCYRELKDTKRMERSIGTLGGGNHFIEVDKDEEGCLYLIVHTGSRNLGTQVANYYQKLAIDLRMGKEELYQKQEQLIEDYKAKGKRKEIQAMVKQLHKSFQQKELDMPSYLCYLEGKYREDYLHDMAICQKYATLNREIILKIIVEHMGWRSEESFETVHNYIDYESHIVRKGAISAKRGEKVLIPINMRDGCIIATGKGNDDWNQSAPHGAGRLMSRSRAKEVLDFEAYKEAMEGIYTTSVNRHTLDEAPMAYKPMEEILNEIEDTVVIDKIIKPIYNYKDF